MTGGSEVFAEISKNLTGSTLARTTARAAFALSQPKSDVSDFGQLKVPNSGKPEFGCGSGPLGAATRDDG